MMIYFREFRVIAHLELLYLENISFKNIMIKLF